jgi:hypothetical protein
MDFYTMVVCKPCPRPPVREDWIFNWMSGAKVVFGSHRLGLLFQEKGFD